jgi:hypothetical protein
MPPIDVMADASTTSMAWVDDAAGDASVILFGAVPTKMPGPCMTGDAETSLVDTRTGAIPRSDAWHDRRPYCER